MDPKGYLTNRAFCPLPWTGFYVEPNGLVRNCVVSKNYIGDIKKNDITEIMSGKDNIDLKQSMLNHKKEHNCKACYDTEQGKSHLNIISSRIYYLKELKSVPLETYEKVDNFDLHQVDIRWNNTCNFACVYCVPFNSSKIEKETGIHVPKPSKAQLQAVKDHVYANIHKLKNVYLAGGEPLLLTDNEEFLDRLYLENPGVMLRINTNLSSTGTKVFDKILKFENVHWTVSVETMEKEFEYVRYGGKWSDFLANLSKIRSLGHKISFNMLWFVLNPYSLFDTIDYFKSIGFQANSFVLGPIASPRHFDIRHLPETALQSLRQKLDEKIALKEGYLLQDGYEVLRKHIDIPYQSNIQSTVDYFAWIDKKRGLDSKQIFKDFYSMLEQA